MNDNVFLDHIKAGIKTEEEMYRLFYYWVKEALTYNEPLEIIKGGKEQFDVALEYLKDKSIKLQCEDISKTTVSPRWAEEENER